MNKTNLLLIILIATVICVGTGVCLSNMNKEKVVVVNKTVNNTTNKTANTTTVGHESNNNNNHAQSVSNDNPKDLPKSKSEIQNEYGSKGHGYEGSIAQSQGISEEAYWNDIYAHQ